MKNKSNLHNEIKLYLAYLQFERKLSINTINAYWLDIKSFIENSELELSAHYKSSKWTNSYTLPNSRSMEIKYHISLSVLLNNGFIPRIDDDRVGSIVSAVVKFKVVVLLIPEYELLELSSKAVVAIVR